MYDTETDMQFVTLFSVSLRNEEGGDRGERQMTVFLLCQLLSDPLVRRRRYKIENALGEARSHAAQRQCSALEGR